MRNVASLFGLLVATACTAVIDGSLPSTGTSVDPSAAGTTATTAMGGVLADAAPCSSDGPGPRVLRPLTRLEYVNTLSDLLSLPAPDIAAVPGDIEERGFTNNVSVATISEARVNGYWTVAESLAARSVTEAYARVVPCGTKDDACAHELIQKLGLRAFRRPLTESEMARFAQNFQPDLSATFEDGVRLTIQGMLMSPFFLLRSELGTEQPAGLFRLTPYELASSLSYLYWGTMPDEALFAAAAAGQLSSKLEIETQARRLLADPRGRRRITDFFYEWLEAPKAYVASKDADTYPRLFSSEGELDRIREAMRAEQDAFVTHVTFDSTRTFPELFTSRTTFLNDRLANYYQLPLPGSANLVPVHVGEAGRGGLLTLGMLLFGHSHPKSSSPTQRGHFIRDHLLCQDIAPPPMNVDVAAELQTDVENLNARERILKITARAPCNACHTLMDPIGFGLEAFDGAGAFRSKDLERDVDATGNIVGLANGGDTATFDGAHELAELVAQSPQAQRCFATNYFRFARGFNPYAATPTADTCAANAVADGFVSGGLELPRLFIAIALQDSFATRSTREVIEK